jgi:hypothetical protein
MSVHQTPADVLMEAGWREQSDGTFTRRQQPGVRFIVKGEGWLCARGGELLGHSRYHEAIRHFLQREFP